ncbi:MAG: hypothetical protein BMS9Abin12_2271 [Acidimicrobiia bacterium]|nr:MAG: hypothetical protein BMS9Abin12_2271 [Acidimicrobiia bacterium]
MRARIPENFVTVLSSMRAYRKPILADLGTMTAVTRKSGTNFDFTTFSPQSYDNSTGPPNGWPPFLCWPPGVPTIFCP